MRTTALKMALMSLVSYVINVSIFTLLLKIGGMIPEVAVAISVSSVMVMNFLACRYWIFEAQSGSFRRQAALFFWSALAFRSAEFIAFSALFRIFNQNEIGTYAFVLAASFAAKLIFFKRHVFRQSL